MLKQHKFCKINPAFGNRFVDHRKLIDVLYSLDVLGWVEFRERYGRTTKMHWHYERLRWSMSATSCRGLFLMMHLQFPNLLSIMERQKNFWDDIISKPILLFLDHKL